MEWKIVNVVASIDLKQRIPLDKVAAKLPESSYNPEQFPGIVIKFPEEGITNLVFSSGKVVCTGSRTRKWVDEAVAMLVKALGKAGVRIKKKPEIRVQNMVVAGKIGERLNLDKLAQHLIDAEYNPEEFPGLIYRLPGTGITFLMFATGKIVCTGARKKEEVDEAMGRLVEELKKYKVVEGWKK